MRTAPRLFACGVALSILPALLPAQVAGNQTRIRQTVWTSAHLVVRGECGCGPVEIRKLPGHELLGVSDCVGGRFRVRIPDTLVQPGESIYAICPGGTPSYPRRVREPNDLELMFRAADNPAPPVETVYFDIVAGPGYDARGLDLLLLPGNWVVRVFTVWNGGSHAGREASPSAWIPLGQALVASNGPDEPTPFPLPFNIPLTPNQPRGFAVEIAGGGAAILPQAAPAGSTGAEMTGIRMISGTTGGAGFTGATGTGKPVGGFWYRAPTPAPIPLYEVQPYETTLDIDGLETNGLAPAVTTPGGGGVVVGGTPAPEVLHADFAVPLMPFDLGIAIAPLVHGFPATAGGQVVNLDVLSPTLFFLNGGAGAPSLQPNPGMFFIPLTGGTTTTILPAISAQMFVIEPAHADGLVLTQGVQYGI